MALTKVIGSGVQGISNSSDATAMTIGSDEVVDFASNADFIDGRGIRLGAGNDFQLYHDGTDNHINVTGAQTLNIQTSGNNAIVVDANGHVTKPLQPAFSAHKNGTSQSNVAKDTVVTVTFDTERFDNNADYNTSNSTFTAPVTGKYFINVTVRLAYIDTASDYVIIAIVTSNEAYRFIVDSTDTMTGDPDYFTISHGVLADMDANDTVDVTYYQSAGAVQTDLIGNPEYTFFTGHLVC
mgnify:CR=1 FL=1|tara:strand:+ start:23 stop:739 length:717 start_codon:yes stop_codon:yes gene_type:complete